MPKTWENCFEFAFFYTCFSFLPPFVTRRLIWIGYISTAINLYPLVFCLLNIIIGNSSFEVYDMAVVFFFLILHSMTFLAQKRKFENFFKKVNQFLGMNEINLLNGHKDMFLKIWHKKKPKIFAKTLFWINFTFLTIWTLITFYRIAFDDNLTKNPYPIYNPGFKSNPLYTCLYTTSNFLASYIIIFHLNQSEIIPVVLLTFLQCEVIYLKRILKEIYDNDCKNINHNIKRWWIENHFLFLKYELKWPKYCFN